MAKDLTQEVTDLMQRKSDLLLYRERVVGEIDEQLDRLAKEIDFKQSENAKRQRAEHRRIRQERVRRTQRLQRFLNR